MCGTTASESDGMGSFLDLCQEVGWDDGLHVYEVRFQYQANGWRALVKAERDGDFVIAWAAGPNLRESMEHLGRLVDAKNLHWLPDRYPPRNWIPGP